MDFLPLDPFHWRDLRTGEMGDALALLCRLCGQDAERPADDTIMEFLIMTGLLPLLENPGTAKALEITPTDLAGFVTPHVSPPDKLPTNVSSKESRKRTADDLLVFIPSDHPIMQVDLVIAARASGIHEKNIRAFMAELTEAKKVFIHKIARTGRKSALGYCRQPAPIGENVGKLSSPLEPQ